MLFNQVNDPSSLGKLHQLAKQLTKQAANELNI